MMARPTPPSALRHGTVTEPLFAAYAAVLLDLDGTVYHGTRAVDGAAGVVRRVRAEGTDVRFVTNNAASPPEEVAERLRGMHITAAADQVATSAQAAAGMLADRLTPAEEVLVVGTDSLAEQVALVGLEPVRQTGARTAAVVQGHSPETGWPILAEACQAIREGALWVACNIDPTLPSERGQLPGNGAMVAALRVATGAEPMIAGKPLRPLFEAAMVSLAPGSALVVGDRLDTDIAGARAAGLDGGLVLSGAADAAAVLVAEENERPNYLLADVNDLLAAVDSLAIGDRPGWSVACESTYLVVSGTGEASSLDLLRAMCRPAWETRVHAVRPADEWAEEALEDLGLR